MQQFKTPTFIIHVADLQSKTYAAASKYFSRVAALYPFECDGNYILGWALLFSGRKAVAKACFECALLIKLGDI
ncbi:hypothetical protein [Pedobacter psychrodurus]|uniref:hypothetical protein n=1 Tax=Pedobacter psychrodurus TaxID=2530456 RepID=UPI00292F59C6|nr:hypothetical protein [Pedobacter psychrodurus]